MFVSTIILSLSDHHLYNICCLRVCMCLFAVCLSYGVLCVCARVCEFVCVFVCICLFACVCLYLSAFVYLYLFVCVSYYGQDALSTLYLLLEARRTEFYKYIDRYAAKNIIQQSHCMHARQFQQ